MGASRCAAKSLSGAGLATSIIAETGLDMTRFPTAAHLVSWPGCAPAPCNRVPAPGPPKATATAHPRGYLGQAANGAASTATFLGERYTRIARRRGKAKAQVAIARSILVITGRATEPGSAGAAARPAKAGYFPVRRHNRSEGPLIVRRRAKPAQAATSACPGIGHHGVLLCPRGDLNRKRGKSPRIGEIMRPEYGAARRRCQPVSGNGHGLCARISARMPVRHRSRAMPRSTAPAEYGAGGGV